MSSDVATAFDDLGEPVGLSLALLYSAGCMTSGFTGGRLSTLVDVGQHLTAQ